MINKTNWKKTKNFIKKHWRLILTIIYILSPIDLIPDVLLPLGYTDDIIVLITAFLSYYARKKKLESFSFDKNKEVYDGEIVEE